MAFVKDSGLTFAQFFGMTKEEKDAYLRKCPFAYKNIDDYIIDVCKWLTQSDWHFSKEAAMQIIKSRMEWIEECFSEKVPIDLAGAEAGYSCG